MTLVVCKFVVTKKLKSVLIRQRESLNILVVCMFHQIEHLNKSLKLALHFLSEFTKTLYVKF